MSARGIGGALTGSVLAVWIVSLAAGYDAVADVHPDLAGTGPGWDHLLGTDHLGRDVLWRLVTASEAFVPAGAAAALTAGALGVLAGALAGYGGGPLEAVIRYVLTVIASIPRFVLVLLAGSILGAKMWVLAIASGVACAPAVGEAVYAQIDGLKRTEFVLAARAHGYSEARILVYHLLWVNCRGLIARNVLQAFGFFLLIETTLSYLGDFGVPQPAPSWGNMLAFELGIHDGNTWAWLAPAVAIAAAILGTALLGQDLGEREGAEVWTEPR